MSRLRAAARLSLACAVSVALSGAHGPQALAPPSAADLEAQQPEDRSFTLDYHQSDIPITAKPSVRDISCRPFGSSPTQLKCRYTLTIGDWIAPEPAPSREVEDILAFGSVGWSIAELDAQSIGEKDRARGLWMGPIRLCGDTVAGAVIESDIDGLAILSLTFRPESAPLLGRETVRRVNARLPVILDGRVIVDPMVMEPILGGKIQLRGPDGPELEAVRQAALGPCREG